MARIDSSLTRPRLKVIFQETEISRHSGVEVHDGHPSFPFSPGLFRHSLTLAGLRLGGAPRQITLHPMMPKLANISVDAQLMPRHQRGKQVVGRRFQGVSSHQMLASDAPIKT
jgi:hypothetical protein